MLDYRQMRSQRVKQLEHQRGQFLNSDNIVAYLGRMPKNVMPFGAERYPGEVSWAAAAAPNLFPLGLDLDRLDAQQSDDLRTWFVAHVNITPPKIRRRPEVSPDVEQLSLL